MKEKRTRRDFFGLLGGVLVGGLAGCAPQRPLPTEAMKADLAILSHVDPKWLTWRLEREVELDLEVPRGICASPEGCWVVGDSHLLRYGPDYALISKKELPGAPRAVVARGQRVYVALLDRVLEASGPSVVAWGQLGANAFLTSLACDATQVYAADSGQRIVHRFDTAGNLLGTIGRRDDEAGYRGLSAPSPCIDLAICPEGYLAVCNPGHHRVEYHHTDGSGLVRAWGEHGDELGTFCGCCNPTHIEIDSAGRVFTSEKGIVRVKQFDSQGRLESVIAPPKDFPQGIVGIDLAWDGTAVLVLDPPDRKIKRYVPAQGGSA